MGRKRPLIAGKHLIYCFGLIFCYVLQTTPGFLRIFGVKPFLVIPAVFLAYNAIWKKLRVSCREVEMPWERLYPGRGVTA